MKTIVDFIDAYGLGKWGEAHTMIYEDHSKKKQVSEWITIVFPMFYQGTVGY